MSGYQLVIMRIGFFCPTFFYYEMAVIIDIWRPLKHAGEVIRMGLELLDTIPNVFGDDCRYEVGLPYILVWVPLRWG